jgi:hypothetical protein
MPPDRFAGFLGGGSPAQFRVWPDRIVIVPPGGQHEPGMGQRGEQGLVEAFVPQATVEALHEAVLHRLARRDVVPLDPSLLRPAQDGRRGQLGAIIADDHMWLAAAAHQGLSVISCVGGRLNITPPWL